MITWLQTPVSFPRARRTFDSMYRSNSLCEMGGCCTEKMFQGFLGGLELFKLPVEVWGWEPGGWHCLLPRQWALREAPHGGPAGIYTSASRPLSENCLRHLPFPVHVFIMPSSRKVLAVPPPPAKLGGLFLLHACPDLPNQKVQKLSAAKGMRELAPSWLKTLHPGRAVLSFRAPASPD